MSFKEQDLIKFVEDNLDADVVLNYDGFVWKLNISSGELTPIPNFSNDKEMNDYITFEMSKSGEKSNHKDQTQIFQSFIALRCICVQEYQRRKTLQNNPSDKILESSSEEYSDSSSENEDSNEGSSNLYDISSAMSSDVEIDEVSDQDDILDISDHGAEDSTSETVSSDENSQSSESDESKPEDSLPKDSAPEKKEPEKLRTKVPEVNVSQESKINEQSTSPSCSNQSKSKSMTLKKMDNVTYVTQNPNSNHPKVQTLAIPLKKEVSTRIKKRMHDIRKRVQTDGDCKVRIIIDDGETLVYYTTTTKLICILPDNIMFPPMTYRSRSKYFPVIIHLDKHEHKSLLDNGQREKLKKACLECRRLILESGVSESDSTSMEYLAKNVIYDDLCYVDPVHGVYCHECKSLRVVNNFKDHLRLNHSNVKNPSYDYRLVLKPFEGKHCREIRTPGDLIQSGIEFIFDPFINIINHDQSTFKSFMKRFEDDGIIDDNLFPGKKPTIRYYPSGFFFCDKIKKFIRRVSITCNPLLRHMEMHYKDSSPDWQEFYHRLSLWIVYKSTVCYDAKILKNLLNSTEELRNQTQLEKVESYVCSVPGCMPCPKRTRGEVETHIKTKHPDQNAKSRACWAVFYFDNKTRYFHSFKDSDK
jgi:hypothetical protein